MTDMERRRDYHDYQAPCFDSIGEPELAPSVNFHEGRARALRDGIDICALDCSCRSPNAGKWDDNE